jgi:hypothetical protein
MRSSAGSLSRRSSLLALAGLAVALTASDTTSASGSQQKLFFIARSKSSAEVHYDARVRPDGSLEPSDTVTGYWRDVWSDGTVHTGPIKLFEKIAYGWDTEPTGNGIYAFKMRAFKDRPMWIVKAGDRWRLRTTVLGKPAYLDKLYVKTDESGLLPKVLYVDIYGQDMASGAALFEHLVKS